MPTVIVAGHLEFPWGIDIHVSGCRKQNGSFNDANRVQNNFKAIFEIICYSLSGTGTTEARLSINEISIKLLQILRIIMVFLSPHSALNLLL